MQNRLANKLLLIGWDGADWQHINPMLENGLMPGLERLIERGVMGNLATLHPVLSPMLWTSIATGKTADKHGILGFTEPNSSGRGVRPLTSRRRRVKAVWNILDQCGLQCHVVGWWASHPAESISGCIVSNFFNGIRRGHDGSLQIPLGTIHPASQSQTLAELKVHQEEIAAADILPFIPRAAEIDQSSDPRLSIVGKLLSDCASIQAATTHLIEREPWEFAAVYIDAIDHFCHTFMPYHPPKMPHISARDFEIYNEVVCGAYRFHDLMLQRLIQLVPHDTTILLCSDHGFQSGSLRPITTPAEPAGPAAWHRDLGIFVMAGPGIKRDDRIYGANIIDITPTILYQFGLPVGEDMDGRVLLDAFEQPPALETIPSWEGVDGASGMQLPLDERTSEFEPCDDAPARDLVKQFAALGYVEDLEDDLELAARRCQLELDYNLARVYLSTNRYEQAVKLLSQLVAQSPWEDRFWKNLAHGYFELGFIRQSQKIMESLYRDMPKPPVYSRVFLAKTCFELGEIQQAKEHLQIAMALNPRRPMIYVMAGRTLVRNNELLQAESMFQRAVDLDADNPHGWLGLAEVALRLRRFEEAADRALSALALLYRLERAHWILGLALLKLSQFDRAQQALQSLLKFSDSDYEVAAHRVLQRICCSLNQPRQADWHGEMARQKFRSHGTRRDHNTRRNQIVESTLVPSLSERFKAHQQFRVTGSKGIQAQVAPGSSGRTLVIVSGLPRSGTSLMMQMLKAGGLPPKTDGRRQPDANNPGGYYEWEAVKQIFKNPQLFDDPILENQAIKVISMLIPGLPRHHRYKVIFMSRSIEEVVVSQQLMIDRIGSGTYAATENNLPFANGAITDRNTACETNPLAIQLEKHRANIIRWLEGKEYVDLLIVSYADLIADPQDQIDRLREFLGCDRISNPSAMLQTIRPELYHQRRV